MPTSFRGRAATRLLNIAHRLLAACRALLGRQRKGKQSGKPRGPRFAAPFWKIGRTVLGADAFPKQPSDLRWDGALVQAVTTEVARSGALATFARLISRGATMEEAQVATTRALLSIRHRHITQRNTAIALAEGLSSAHARNLGLGLSLHDRALFGLAWTRLCQVDEDTLTRLVPVEAVDCALAVGTPEAVAFAFRIAERASELGTRDVAELSGRFLVTGHLDVARALVEEADRRRTDDLDTVVSGDDYSTRDVLENIRRWTDPTPREHPADISDGAVTFAVMDYDLPDLKRASRNVGDYIQTLALISNLARFQRTRFIGSDGLGELVASLQDRVRPELRIEGNDTVVHLMPVSRDFSEGEDIPPNTWMVAFGWHMHSLFEIRFGLPYHPNINPLFVSFHLNDIRALTPEAIEYLKERGPIGCRDWTTVDLLLSAGVDAFFTGCVTATVSAVFPEIADVEREQPGVVAAIDAPIAGVRAERPIEKTTHRDSLYREIGMVEGLRLAIELLETYQRRYCRIVTSRLHSYLPATSLGVPVTFTPRKVGDVRFDGLLGLAPDTPAFIAMQDGLRELLAAILEQVFAGAGRDDVYDLWRASAAPFVAEARKRHEAPLPPDDSAPTLDVPGLVKTIRERARAFGPHDAVDPATVADVTLSLDQNLKQHLPATLEALIGNASGPLRLWILGRGLDESYQQWISDAWPDVPMTFLNFDGVDYGEIGRMIPWTTVSTMDRLLLPELLAEVDRIIHLDVDTVIEGNVCELAAMDLGSHALAARTSVYSVTEHWRRAGKRLSAEKASDLRRTMSARHAFDYRNFNAGVLVLDLARMRADNFVATYLPLVARFGLHDQEVLHVYVGPNRAELDERWNTVPFIGDVTAPLIIHFAGEVKPWDEQLTPLRERWELYAARVRARVGDPPA